MDQLATFDPFNPDHQSIHHDVMAELRETCPVARLTSGVVVVSRFGDAKATLNDPRMRNDRAGRAPGVDVPPEDRLFFFEYDPPEHLTLRHLVLDLLSRQRAEDEAPRTRVLFEELLAPLLGEGGGELVSGLSVPFAGRLMMRVAGLPEADAPRWRAWIKDMVVTGFSFTNRNERGIGFEQCYPDVLAYLDDHLAARAALAVRPPDVLTRVTTAQLDNEPVPHTLQRMIVMSVVSAGTNTMVNFLSNTLLSLARDPLLVETIRADRSLVPVAVEESLRRDSPSMYLSRTCPEGAEIEGAAIVPNERVLVGLASANRDETVFPGATEFRLDRTGQPGHLAFGWGSHLCVGAPIVRTAGAAALNTLLDQVAAMEVEAGTIPLPYLSPQGNGLDELRLRLTPRP